jgi:hypothetical protein
MLAALTKAMEDDIEENGRKRFGGASRWGNAG